MAYSAYHFVHPHYRNNWELYKFRAEEFLFDSVRGGTPNLAHFQTGCIRVALFEIYDMLHETTLTSEQRGQIEKYYGDHSMRITHHQRNHKIKNVIFILLESFLSDPIDLEVNGKEILILRGEGVNSDQAERNLELAESGLSEEYIFFDSNSP